MVDWFSNSRRRERVVNIVVTCDKKHIENRIQQRLVKIEYQSKTFHHEKGYWIDQKYTEGKKDEKKKNGQGDQKRAKDCMKYDEFLSRGDFKKTGIVNDLLSLRKRD